jgi:tRNA-specific 2-thiouridylase
VRELAQRFGLPTFDKPDSQEICFVPDNDYAGLVERRRPELAQPGRILRHDGQDLGEHSGQHRFTVGQRKGLGNVAAGYPLFVLNRDATNNTVTVGPREMLATSSCIAGEANWLIDPGEVGRGPRRILAKYRYNTPPASASIVELGEDETGTPTPSGRKGRFEVIFDEAQEAVAPGQAVVIYDGAEPDRVLGGGWIQATSRARRDDPSSGRIKPSQL